MKKILLILSLVTAFSFLSAGILTAQPGGDGDITDISGLADKPEDTKDDDSGDEKKKFSLHGFLRANFVTMKKDKEFDGNFENPLMGTVLQLQLEANAGDIAHFYAATNLEYNNYDEEDPNGMKAAPYLNVIEAYVDLYPARWFSLRAGHQLISWGEIDGIIAPTDTICPWNYDIKTTSFEEYKMGVTAIAANFFVAKKHKIELVWIPVFQPSRLPADEIERRGDIGAITVTPEIVRPDYKISNGEYAGRFSGTIGDNMRYGFSFLYGYDDLPDTIIDIPGSYIGLYYNRVMVPAADFSYDIKDLFAVKASGAMKITEDFDGNDYTKRNSTIEYLTGVESANVGLGIYLAFYAGQMWVVNYTKPITDTEKLTIGGFDQDHKYKWLVSSVIQRNFLANDVLELSLRWALSMDPGLSEIDYTVNFNTTYKWTSGVSTTLGFVIADKIDTIQNTVLLEVKYQF